MHGAPRALLQGKGGLGTSPPRSPCQAQAPGLPLPRPHTELPAGWAQASLHPGTPLGPAVPKALRWSPRQTPFLCTFMNSLL